MIVGNPIQHSLSPVIHQQFAEQTGQMLCYERLLAPLNQFIPTIRAFFARGGRGCNVTLPFKEQALAMVDDYSEYAGCAKAINTIILKEDGSLYGENTDGVGLVRDLTQNLRWPLRGQRILLIGAGGAVRGVLPALLAESPAEIAIMNRTVEKAKKLADEFDLQLYSSHKQSFDIVINGASGNIEFSGETRCYYDMNYYSKIPPTPPFAKGGITKGLGMLVEQAAESFFLWRGVRPDTQPVLQKLKNRLNIVF